MQSTIHDLRYALRQLRKSPGFTLTALLTLALGLGIAAAVYCVVQAVLLEPLPYPDQSTLVGLGWTFPRAKPNAEQAGNSAEFVRDHAQAFSSTAVMDDGMAPTNLSVNGGHAIQVYSQGVSEGYFRTLGVSPWLGRGFSAEEDRRGAPRTVILSYRLWAREFNRDPEIAGRTIRLNEEAFTVVGVMPANFAVSGESSQGVVGAPDLWQPLKLNLQDPGYYGDNYQMIGRLRPGVTLAQAQQQLSALNDPFYREFPKGKTWVNESDAPHEFHLWKLQDVAVSDVRRSLLTVMGAVLAVLLVACLNLAGLTIARSMRRSREIALRAALGATQPQLLRLLACEGLLLALGGGVLALLVARLAARALLYASPLAIPTLQGEPSLALAGAVLAVGALASTGVFSVLPAWLMLRRRGGEMRLGSTSVGDTVSQARVSRTLMVVQVALAMVLVSTASLLLGTFVRLRALPSGVEPKQLTVFQVQLKGDRYATTLQTTQFVATVMERLSHAPGVEHVAAVNGLPLDRGLNMGGNPADRLELRQIIEFRAVTPGFFQTMGIPLLAGRDLAESDRAGGNPVIVIGATAAKKWWPGRSPIGESIRIGNERNWRIVGVAADVQMHSLVESRGIEIYGSMAQLSDAFTAIDNNWFSTSFAIRTAAHIDLAQAVERAVAQADAEIPVSKLTTMQAVIDNTIEEPRFFSLLAACFSGFALLLTVIGLFGLLSYQVTQRTREIGVRMALGAGRLRILNIFLGRGLTLACAGIVLGLAASWMLRPVIMHLLSDAGVKAVNGGTGSAANVVMNGAQATVVAVLAILSATLGASWLPARRASLIEPMEALRAE